MECLGLTPALTCMSIVGLLVVTSRDVIVAHGRRVQDRFNIPREKQVVSRRSPGIKRLTLGVGAVMFSMSGLLGAAAVTSYYRAVTGSKGWVPTHAFQGLSLTLLCVGSAMLTWRGLLRERRELDGLSAEAQGGYHITVNGELVSGVSAGVREGRLSLLSEHDVAIREWLLSEYGCDLAMPNVDTELRVTQSRAVEVVGS